MEDLAAAALRDSTLWDRIDVETSTGDIDWDAVRDLADGSVLSSGENAALAVAAITAGYPPKIWSWAEAFETSLTHDITDAIVTAMATKITQAHKMRSRFRGRLR